MHPRRGLLIKKIKIGSLYSYLKDRTCEMYVAHHKPSKIRYNIELYRLINGADNLVFIKTQKIRWRREY